MLRFGLLIPLLLLLTACYPFFHYQSPEIIPRDDEITGMGFSMMSNVMEASLDTTDVADSFFADVSVFYRRGMADRFDMGLKLAGRPWSPDIVMLDGRYGLWQSELKLTTGFGISYIRRMSSAFIIGYHPSINLGYKNKHISAGLNYLRHGTATYLSYDLVMGAEFWPDEDTNITPQLGIHIGQRTPENIYYSLGFKFTTPVTF